nr:hypothetical protein [Athalassotoga saccharophila]
MKMIENKIPPPMPNKPEMNPTRAPMIIRVIICICFLYESSSLLFDLEKIKNKAAIIKNIVKKMSTVLSGMNFVESAPRNANKGVAIIIGIPILKSILLFFIFKMVAAIRLIPLIKRPKGLASSSGNPK